MPASSSTVACCYWLKKYGVFTFFTRPPRATWNPTLRKYPVDNNISFLYSIIKKLFDNNVTVTHIIVPIFMIRHGNKKCPFVTVYSSRFRKVHLHNFYTKDKILIYNSWILFTNVFMRLRYVFIYVSYLQIT